MIQAALGIIDKMKIEIFGDPELENIKDTIYVQLNPDKYSTTKTIVYTDKQPIGSSQNVLSYQSSNSETASFEFLFDSTGVVPPAKKDGGGMSLSSVASSFVPFNFGQAKSVSKDLSKFKDLLSEYDGNTHEPPHLRLTWGEFILKGRLTSMEVQYYMFNSQGEPLRAIARCSFSGSTTIKLLQEKQQPNSPDLTHERIFTMGDRLSVMAEKIYESPDYYTDVAKANGLLSFRDIPTGTKLLFPPIK
jgi:hypothetical protein